MWNYEKRLQYPINITTPNAKIAQIIMSQYGGPDGEMGASMRYLSQRYSMPDRRVCGVLTDIGTEELAHLEMVASIVRQLTKGLSAEELEAAGFAPYYVDHTGGIWPQAAGGIPFNACEFQSKGDALTDLFEDMAAEQKARTTYDNILRLVKDPDVCDPIRFLREREVVHFQRFGEALRIIQDDLDSKNFYAFNPEFDIPNCPQLDNLNCSTSFCIALTGADQKAERLSHKICSHRVLCMTVFFIYTIYSCRSNTHSTYSIMYVLFELCNLKLADQFTQILSLTAHLLAGSRTFLGCCGIRLYNVIDLLDSFIDLMDCCCLRL